MEGGLATPTRDWRGARSALQSNGAEWRNPGKPVTQKNAKSIIAKEQMVEQAKVPSNKEKK